MSYYYLYLPFQVVQIAYLDASEVTVNVNHNRDGYCGFRSRDGDGKQCKEIALHSSRKEKTVEHGEVDIPNGDGTFTTLEGEKAQKWYDKAGEEDQQEAAEEASTQSIEDVK